MSISEPHNSPGPGTLTQPLNNNHVDEDSDLEDICEVVLSFKCKFCTFLCHDKNALTTHFRDIHFSSVNGTSRSEANKTGSAEFSTENLSQTDQDDEEMFFCSACNIFFPTEETCCKHMVEIHSIWDFNTDKVRDGDKQQKDNSPDKPATRSRPVKPPHRYTREGGAVVPKKYQVTKDNHFSRCTYCNLKFESLEIAQFHEQCHAIEATHGTIMRGYYCLMCLGNTNQTQNQGNASSSSVTTDTEPQTGDVESGPFDNWGRCAFHLWKVHKIDCELYGCPQDGCEFKSYYHSKLVEHEAIHSDLASFKCETCHKVFKQLKQLRTHEKYHKDNKTKLPPPSESRWYTSKECPICKRVLSDSKCLKKHIAAVHNRIKPHICNICGHSSARKAELQLHTRQHSGEKPFKCSLCDFATGDHNSLRKHKLTHTKSKTYACKLCPFTCIQSSGFKKHVIAKHPEEEGSIFVCPFCPLISVNKVKYEGHLKDHDEGRIPIVEMDLNNSAGNAGETTAVATRSRSASTENHHLTATPPPGPSSAFSPSEQRASTISNPPTPNYWLRDDDSLDLVDTGGITIPAPIAPEDLSPLDSTSTESRYLIIDLSDQC